MKNKNQTILLFEESDMKYIDEMLEVLKIAKEEMKN